MGTAPTAVLVKGAVEHRAPGRRRMDLLSMTQLGES